MEKVERFQQVYKYLYDHGEFHSKADLAKRLGRTRTNVSEAYYGRAPFFNDKFLQSFCREFPAINYEWLINGTGQMLNEPNIKPQDSIIELCAQLIRRVDDLRNDLTAELDALRREREEMKEERRVMQKLIKQLQKHSIGYPQPYETGQQSALMVAEPGVAKTED